MRRHFRVVSRIVENRSDLVVGHQRHPQQRANDDQQYPTESSSPGGTGHCVVSITVVLRGDSHQFSVLWFAKVVVQSQHRYRLFDIAQLDDAQPQLLYLEIV